MRSPSTVVIGGGIAGLSTALSLHAEGLPVEVFEAVEQVQALGVGINLQPHAVRELDALGLMDSVLAEGIEAGAGTRPPVARRRWPTSPNEAKRSGASPAAWRRDTRGPRSPSTGESSNGYC